MEESLEETIIKYYKNPKKGLNITTTFRNLLKDGYKITLKQIDETIKNHDSYSKGKKYKEQKDMFLKTVTGSMHSYQADSFKVKLHSKSYVQFVALINIETRKGYVYHVPNIQKKTVIHIFFNSKK